MSTIKVIFSGFLILWLDGLLLCKRKTWHLKKISCSSPIKTHGKVSDNLNKLLKIRNRDGESTLKVTLFPINRYLKINQKQKCELKKQLKKHTNNTEMQLRTTTKNNKSWVVIFHSDHSTLFLQLSTGFVYLYRKFILYYWSLYVISSFVDDLYDFSSTS